MELGEGWGRETSQRGGAILSDIELNVKLNLYCKNLILK